MTSFQTTTSSNKRAAARFIGRVRRALQLALIEEAKKRGLTQSDIARELGVHRSVINRELRGEKDLTLGRVGELAHVLGRRPEFHLPEVPAAGNHIGFKVKLPEPQPPIGKLRRAESNSRSAELEVA